MTVNKVEINDLVAEFIENVSNYFEKIVYILQFFQESASALKNIPISRLFQDPKNSNF